MDINVNVAILVCVAASRLDDTSDAMLRAYVCAFRAGIPRETLLTHIESFAKRVRKLLDEESLKD